MAVTMTTRVCLVCGDLESSTVLVGAEDRFGVGGSFPVVACARCSFTWTALSAEFDLGAWYDRGYWTEPGQSADGRGSKTSAYGLRMAWSAWRAFNGSARPTRWVRTGRVLDVGCGSGYDTVEMIRSGANVVSIDLSERALRQAASADVPPVRATPLAYPFADDTCDVVVMSQVLKHVTDPLAALESTRRILRPGGKLLLLAPNSRGLRRRAFGSHWANWHLPYHLWHFDRGSLTTLLERAGFTTVRCATVSPGEWLLLSCGLRWRRLQEIGEHRTLSRLILLVATPGLRLIDLLGGGDCLVVEATPNG